MSIDLLALLTLLACGKTPVEDETICEPGRAVDCACESGLSGAQLCADDGLAWLDCACEAPAVDTEPPDDSDTPPVDTATADSASETGADSASETGETGETGDPQPAPDVLDVYLLAGQSNMVGYSQDNGLPPSLRVAQPDVRMYRSGEPWWKPLEPASDIAGYFGPEVTFGRTMADADPEQRTALIKHAVGGTDLVSYWYPGEYPDDPAAGAGYAAFIQTVRAGLAELTVEGEDWRIAGMLWMQGESDTFAMSYALAYGSNLERLIARVREDVEAPEMPFVAGLIDCPGCPSSERDLVRQATADVASLYETVYAVESEDLLGQPDGYHYTGVGMKVLGERFAQALLETDQSAAPTPAVTVTGSYRFDYSGDFMVGYAFTLTREVTLSAMGLFDIYADGLGSTSQVGLWREDDAALLALATVPSAATQDSSYVDGFRYIGVEPLALPAGDYVIAAQSFSGSERYIHAAPISTGDAVTWREGRHNYSNAVAFPVEVVGGDTTDASWFGASFLYTE